MTNKNNPTETKSALEYGKEVWFIQDENGKIIEKFSCKRNALDFIKGRENLVIIRSNSLKEKWKIKK